MGLYTFAGLPAGGLFLCVVGSCPEGVPLSQPTAVPPSPPKGRRTGTRRPGVLRRGLIAGVLVLAVVGAYALTLRSFLNESERQANPTVVSDGAGPDHVTISGTVVQVDPARSETTVRLIFTPEGKYATADGSLAQAMVVKVDNATGLSDRPFEKGKTMSPSDVVVSMTGGRITDYPFDATNAVVGLYLSTQAVSAAPAVGDKPAVEAVESVPVEVNLDLQAAVHGFSIETAPDPESQGPFAGIDLTIRRSGSTLFFSIFIMTLLWILTLGGAGIAWRILSTGRKAEIPMCQFLGVLLFAFPAVRNLQPAAPPIGALSDFLAFFWCEALVAISLCFLLGHYVLRSLRAEREAVV